MRDTGVLNCADLLIATGGTLVSEGLQSFRGVSIDSRTIAEGDLFFALKGERHDGHDYVASVLQKAGGVVVSRTYDCSRIPVPSGEKTIIAVDDPGKALQAAAAYRRRQFRGMVVGIVGSNGKTTTKELVAAVLGRRFVVHKTTGNLNNHIGMPLSLLRMSDEAEVLVMEMGTNQPGDVRELCEIAQPTVGVITNIGMEHLQGFGSLEGVREAELEVLPFIETAIVNADDAFLMDGMKGRFQGKILSFGINSEHAAIRGRDCAAREHGTGFVLESSTGNARVELRLFGMFNVSNALAAATAGVEAGLSLDEIRQGIESFAGVAMRFAVVRQGGVTWLADMYNANPSSMDASVGELLRFRAQAKRAVAVLGDMLELGEQSAELHAALGRKLAADGVDLFVGVGPFMKEAVSAYGETALAADDAVQAAALLKDRLQPDDVVLIKGSRGMRMERVCEALGVGLA